MKKFSFFKIFTIYLLLYIVVVSTTSCSSKLSREEYIKWVRNYENNAHVQMAQGDFIVDIQYQPSEYVLLQRGGERYPESIRTEELKKISSIQYYTITIARKDKADLISYGTNSLEEKEERQYYFSYRFQNDITIQENGKTLPCVLFHGEKPAITNGGRTFVVGFENPDNSSLPSQIIIDSDLVGVSPIKVEVSKSNIPRIDL